MAATASMFACVLVAAVLCLHLTASSTDAHLAPRREQRVRARRSSHPWDELRGAGSSSQTARDSLHFDEDEEEEEDRDEKDLLAAAKRKSSFRGDLGKRRETSSKKSKGFRGDLGKRSSGFRSDLGQQAKRAWYEEGYLSA